MMSETEHDLSVLKTISCEFPHVSPRLAYLRPLLLRLTSDQNIISGKKTLVAPAADMKKMCYYEDGLSLQPIFATAGDTAAVFNACVLMVPYMAIGTPPSHDNLEDIVHAATGFEFARRTEFAAPSLKSLARSIPDAAMRDYWKQNESNFDIVTSEITQVVSMINDTMSPTFRNMYASISHCSGHIRPERAERMIEAHGKSMSYDEILKKLIHENDGGHLEQLCEDRMETAVAAHETAKSAYMARLASKSASILPYRSMAHRAPLRSIMMTIDMFTALSPYDDVAICTLLTFGSHCILICAYKKEAYLLNIRKYESPATQPLYDGPLNKDSSYIARGLSALDLTKHICTICTRERAVQIRGPPTSPITDTDTFYYDTFINAHLRTALSRAATDYQKIEEPSVKRKNTVRSGSEEKKRANHKRSKSLAAAPDKVQPTEGENTEHESPTLIGEYDLSTAASMVVDTQTASEPSSVEHTLPENTKPIVSDDDMDMDPFEDDDITLPVVALTKTSSASKSTPKPKAKPKPKEKEKEKEKKRAAPRSKGKGRKGKKKAQDA